MTAQSLTTGQRSVNGFLWTAAGFGAQAAAQLAVLALLARFLTAAEFGVVSVALMVVGFGGIVTDAIVGPAITQRPRLTNEHVRTAFSISVYVGLVACLCLWIWADWIAALFSMSELTSVGRALSTLFIVESFSVVPIALMQRDLAFRKLATIETTSFLIGYAGVGCVLAAMGTGVWALVAAQLGYSTIRSIIVLLRRPHPKSLRVSRSAAADILTFGSGHAVGKLFNYAALQGDYFVIGRWMSAASLGVYGRAYQMAMRPAVMLGQALDKVIFPVMSSLQHDVDRLSKAFHRVISLNALISIPAGAIAVLLGPEVIRVVLGPGWEGAVVPFQILVGGLVFRTGYKSSDSLARATGRVFNRAWRQALYAGLVFVGALVGTRWGLNAVAAFVMIAIFANYLMMASLSIRVLGATWSSFAAAHNRGLVLAAAVTAIALPTTLLLRNSGTNSFVVLVSTLAAVALVLGAIVRIRPTRVLGPDVMWLAGRLRDQLPSAR
jgi:PST family polysaccharide transporter